MRFSALTPSESLVAQMARLLSQGVYAGKEEQVCEASSNSCVASQHEDYFGHIPYVKYEGPATRNPYAFRYYNKEELILGKPMKEWLRFSVAFWHSFRGDGSDPFGVGTRLWPWDDGSDSLTNAFERMRANFELLQKVKGQRKLNLKRDILTLCMQTCSIAVGCRLLVLPRSRYCP